MYKKLKVDIYFIIFLFSCYSHIMDYYGYDKFHFIFKIFITIIFRVATWIYDLLSRIYVHIDANLLKLNDIEMKIFLKILSLMFYSNIS